MKQRKASDFRSLSVTELSQMISDNQEALAKQTFQHSLKQLQDTAYLKILKKDIARMKTVLTEKQAGN